MLWYQIDFLTTLLTAYSDALYLYGESLLMEVLNVDVILKFQLFPVFDVSITGIEKKELRQCATCTNPFLCNLCSDEIWIYNSGTIGMNPT